MNDIWNDTLYTENEAIKYVIRVGPTELTGLQQLKVDVSQCSTIGSELWMSLSLTLAEPSFRFPFIYFESNHPELFKRFHAESYTDYSTKFVSHILLNVNSKKLIVRGLVVVQKSPIYPESLCDEKPNFCVVLHREISYRMHDVIYSNVTRKLKDSMSDLKIDF